jgi:hypothetical protein
VDWIGGRVAGALDDIVVAGGDSGTLRDETPNRRKPAPQSMIGVIRPIMESTIRNSVASLVGFGLFTGAVSVEIWSGEKARRAFGLSEGRVSAANLAENLA